MTQIRQHRKYMAMLTDVEPADRFAYALYQAHCIGADFSVGAWTELSTEVRAGWRAAADFSKMYTHMIEVDAIVRAL